MAFAAIFIPFFAITAAFVLVGLSGSHSSVHGTSGIPNWLDFSLGGISLRQIAGLSNRAARALVSKFAGSHLKMLTAYLHGMASLWKQEFAAMRAEAKATSDVAHALERAIPREAHKAAAPALARAKVADRHANHALSVGRTTSREFNRFRTTTRARLKADAHAIDVTIPRDIGRIRTREKQIAEEQKRTKGRVGELENGAIKTWDWIRSHPLGLAAGVFAGAVAVALGRLGLGGLRCNNLKNLLRKRGCGVWSGLEGLLAAVAAFGIAADFRDVVKAAVAIEGEASAALVHLATLDDAAIMDAARAVAKSANSIAGA